MSKKQKSKIEQTLEQIDNEFALSITNAGSTEETRSLFVDYLLSLAKYGLDERQSKKRASCLISERVYFIRRVNETRRFVLLNQWCREVYKAESFHNIFIEEIRAREYSRT